MEISPISLLQMLFVSFVMGGGLGVLCDLYKVIWMLLGAYGLSHHSKDISPSKSKKISKQCIVFLGDICFFVILAGLIVVLNYTYNDGKMRIYTGIGLLFGYYVYRKSIGKWFLFGGEKLVFFVKRIFLSVFSFLFYPFRKVFSFLYKKIKKIFKNIKKALEKKAKKVYNLTCKVLFSKKRFLKEAEHKKQK